MDQEPGAGHHAVTHMAAELLFKSPIASSGGTIGGLHQTEFFHALDKAQHYADRWYGRTSHAAWADPGAQRQHAMASPYKSGIENLHTDRDYVVKELDNAQLAHQHGRADAELKHLGLAVHAIEDSYSEAHAFRDKSAHAGNPDAKIEAFNVFDPLGLSTEGPKSAPVSHVGEGTHDARFDQVPVDKQGDPTLPEHQAAAKAVAETLQKYYEHRDGDRAGAHDVHKETVDRFFQPSDGGVTVNKDYDEHYRHERDERLEIREHYLDSLHHHDGSPTPPPDPAKADPHPQAPGDARPYDKLPSDAGIPGGLGSTSTGWSHFGAGHGSAGHDGHDQRQAGVTHVAGHPDTDVHRADANDKVVPVPYDSGRADARHDDKVAPNGSRLAADHDGPGGPKAAYDSAHTSVPHRDAPDGVQGHAPHGDHDKPATASAQHNGHAGSAQHGAHAAQTAAVSPAYASNTNPHQIVGPTQAPVDSYAVGHDHHSSTQPAGHGVIHPDNAAAAEAAAQATAQQTAMAYAHEMAHQVHVA